MVKQHPNIAKSNEAFNLLSALVLRNVDPFAEKYIK